MKFVYNKEKGKFMSEDNEEIKYTNIKYVNLAIKSKDKENEIESEVLGMWTYELLDGADVYYVLINGQVTEFVAYKVYCKPKYIINMDGQIIECLPEENDVVFSDYKEAKLLTFIQNKIDTAINL